VPIVMPEPPEGPASDETRADANAAAGATTGKTPGAAPGAASGATPGAAPSASSPASSPTGGAVDPRVAEMAELRRLLVGAERARIDAQQALLEQNLLTPENLAERLPEAIVMRAGQDKQLARALAPTVESAISESVRRKPAEFADAIFPVLGPAIRKAIAETMAELVGSINRAMQHSFSARGLSWRFEAWRTGTPYAQVVIKHALVYRVEQVFLVHRETGLLLAQAHPPHLKVPDADLVSGMLTAIRDFVGDSFANEKDVGGLRTFSVGELTVMVEQGPRALIAAVVRGQAPESYVRRLQEAIEAVHAQFSTALSEFDGDATAFEAAKPILDDCLVTVLATDPPAGTKANWKPYAWAMGLLIVGAVAWTAWQASRWARVMADLRATPGIVVVESTRGWRTHSVRGLRDPDATSPNAVFASAGYDTTRLEQQWEPYHSLQLPLVIRRVQRLLGAPASGTAAYAVHGDTLVVSGALDAAWLARAARRTAWPAGVGAVDLHAAEPVVPASLTPMADSLVRGRVLFSPGSSELDDAARATIRGAARQARQLVSSLDAQGVGATVTLTGRADATGTDSSNASLSRDRAEVVRQAIDAALRDGAKAPVVRFEPKGVGTSAPIAEGDATARARLNRSVSFGIRLSIDAPSGARPQ
jgi:OOP family OmpA-OmpF porin